MNLPRIILLTWLLSPCSAAAFTAHPRGSVVDRRASHRLYDTSVSDFWSSIAATAISPTETILTTVSLASVSALVGAANAGLAARESQRQAEMKGRLETQQADLGKFQKSVENLNRLAQVLTATGTLSAAYVLLNIVPLVDQSSKIPPTSPQVLAEKRAAVRSANKPESSIDDLKLPVTQKFDSIIKDFSPTKSSEQADWIKEKEDKMNALLEKKREALLADSVQPDVSKTQAETKFDSIVGELKVPSKEQATKDEAPKSEVKKEDVKKDGFKTEAKKGDSKAEVKKEEPKKDEMKAKASSEEPKKEEVKAEVKKDDSKKKDAKADVKEEEPKKEEVKAEAKKEEPKKEEVKAEVKKEELKKEEPKKEELKAEAKKEEVKAEAKKDEPKKEEVKADVKKDEAKKDEVKAEANKDEPKKDEVQADVKKEEPKKDELKAEAKKDEPKKDELKADVKKEEPKKDELKAEAKKDEPKKEELKAEAKTEAPKNEQISGVVKKEEPKKVEIKPEVNKELVNGGESRQSVVQPEAKRDESKKVEIQPEVGKEESKQESKAEINREAPKKNEKKAESKKEEPLKEEIKATSRTEDNLMSKLMNKIDEPEKVVEESTIKEPSAENKNIPIVENDGVSASSQKEETVAPIPSRTLQTVPDELSAPAPTTSIESFRQAADIDLTASITPFLKNALKNMDAVFTGIGRTTSTLARQVTKLLPQEVAKDIEKVNDKDVGILTSVAFLATTVGGFVISATRDDEPDSKKQRAVKPKTGDNRSLQNNGINGDNKSTPAETSRRISQPNSRESPSRLPSTDSERRNGFGSYLEQISRGDSQKDVNGTDARGDSRWIGSQRSPSAWNATGLSDPDSWDPRDFDPLTQSLSGRAVSQPTDTTNDKRQSVSRPNPPASVSAQVRSPVKAQQSQTRQSPTQRTPPVTQPNQAARQVPPRPQQESQRSQGRNAPAQSTSREDPSDRKSAWTPPSNNAPYTNPSTLMPTDVAQLSQPPLRGQPQQTRQGGNAPERPIPQSDKKATWTPPSNNAPYTNPSTLMPTDVTPVDGDSYLGSLSASSSSTRPRGSYNPFGRPVAANAENSPTSETTANREGTVPSNPVRAINAEKQATMDTTGNLDLSSARPDTRSQSQQTSESTASKDRVVQADLVAPARGSQPSTVPANVIPPVEPPREVTPQRTISTTPPARRSQSPLVPADLIRPVEPDITSVTRATIESRTQPTSMQRSNNANSNFSGNTQGNQNQPRNGFQSNGENVSSQSNNIGSTRSPGEAPSGTNDNRRVDSVVGPDQPPPNRTPWISSGSSNSNEQSDYNPRNFDPRTQSFRETLGPASRVTRQNGQG